MGGPIPSGCPLISTHMQVHTCANQCIRGELSPRASPGLFSWCKTSAFPMMPSGLGIPLLLCVFTNGLSQCLVSTALLVPFSPPNQSHLSGESLQTTQTRASSLCQWPATGFTYNIRRSHWSWLPEDLILFPTSSYTCFSSSPKASLPSYARGGPSLEDSCLEFVQGPNFSFFFFLYFVLCVCVSMHVCVHIWKSEVRYLLHCLPY